MRERINSVRLLVLSDLAARIGNVRLAAAHLNPLQHFLQFGIYEGRLPHSDGLRG